MSDVLFSPISAIHSDCPPGVICTGSPGSGKSFAMLQMASNSLEESAKVFILDAKDDMLSLKNLYPDIKTTNVNNISPGSLDPFLVLDDVDSTVLLTIIEIMCGEITPSQRLAIVPIVGDFVSKKGRANFRDLANYLYQNRNEHAQAIGTQLLLVAKSRYGNLIFGTAGKRSRALVFKNESRIISIFGLNLFSEGSSHTPDKALDAAIVYIICRMLKNILTRKTRGGKLVDKTPTVLFLDECHILMKSSAIKDIIDELLVLGRSLGVAVCMATQNVTHFDKKIAQLVSSKFSFKMSKQEAVEFFALFDNTISGMELDTREGVEIITRLRRGHCFFIDSKERCALIHIVASARSQELLTSNPLKKKG